MEQYIVTTPDGDRRAIMAKDWKDAEKQASRLWERYIPKYLKLTSKAGEERIAYRQEWCDLTGDACIEYPTWQPKESTTTKESE